MKGVDFENSSSPGLSSPTLHMVVEIDVTYHLNIDIADVTNVFQNTLKASS